MAYKIVLILIVFQILFGLNTNGQIRAIQESEISSALETQCLSERLKNGRNDLFGTSRQFVENVGQFGDSWEEYPEMGPIIMGYEGFNQPVLFTKKGLIYLQKKEEPIALEKKEEMLKRGITQEEIATKNKITERSISMTWIGSNPDVEIITEFEAQAYRTYGMIPNKARTFKQITYKEIYPHIDVVYHFTELDEIGFEYTIIAHPGADLGQLQMEYGGDVKSTKLSSKGELRIKSSLGTITESCPVSYYASQPDSLILIPFEVKKNTVSFAVPSGLNPNEELLIDPFVSATNNLLGTNLGDAKDVDFDYDGNVYVSGGGTLGSHMLAKYNAAGVLQWTFSGSLINPAWTFGPYYGGWVVDKPTGGVYMGQGFNFTSGFIIVRLSTQGLYDNYVSTGNPSFLENWKMIWSCNNGNPQIIIAGGGVNSNINLGLISPPSTVVTANNITNITGSAFQDMADMVIDPVTNSMYTIYASGSVPALNNSIYRNNAPYTSASIVWNVASGYPSLQEAANRPYLGGVIDNSANVLAINASYLFYWNGKDLKAFNKNTGAAVGTPLSIGTNIKLMQGGIVADACNNIFVGSSNGTIKVYQFNGSTFNDAAAPDLTVAGYGTSSVYDLAYNEAQSIIYASGNGFVSAFDVSSYTCNSSFYTVSVTSNCGTGSATASVSPSPPVGSTVTYTLFDGTTQIASNTTGVFTSLSPNINYTVVATINQSCSGVQATTDFVLPGPTLNLSSTNTTCGTFSGTINAIASNSAGPYTYSLNGGSFVSSGNFSGLDAGVYTVAARDGGGCETTLTVTILNSDGPSVSYTKTDATCGNSSGTVTATGTGINLPLQYSLDGTTFQSSNVFVGLLPGNYSLTVVDASGCLNAVSVDIDAGPQVLLTAIPSSATCGDANGGIEAFGSEGTPPLEYSINGNSFFSTSSFSDLAPGSYTVMVRDLNNCITTTNVTIGNVVGPTVTASSIAASCSAANGSIIAVGTGTATPLQYSINGINFQNFNIFSGLVPGQYTVTVRDANGCTSQTAVALGSVGGPNLTVSSTSSTCNGNTGTITASTTGGNPPYTYSLDGFTFQASSTFSGLSAGTYIVLVRDAGQCMSAYPVTILDIAGPDLSASSSPTGCNVNNGSITATGTGGTGLLEYSLDGLNYQSSATFSGLGTGTYTVFVRDANNCVNSFDVDVDNTMGLSLFTSVVSANCDGSSNGAISAIASGNNPPLQYSINGVNYFASNTFSGLSTGTYTVYVRDNGGCVLSETVELTAANAPQVSASAINSTCTSSNGGITAIGSGGTGVLQYTIDGVNYQDNGDFNYLSSGNYTVTVLDENGCAASEFVTVPNVGAGPGITSFTVEISGTYPCNGDNEGKIKKPRVNGVNCNSCTFSLDGGPFVANATNIFTNVLPGVHTVTAMDANGCTYTIEILMEPAELSTVTATVVGADCGTTDGSMTLTGVGDGPFHVSFNGANGPWIEFEDPETISDLAPGTYTLMIADDESFENDLPGGCVTYLTVVIPSTNGPSLSVTQTNGVCALDNGSINAVGSGGAPPLSYSINGINFQSSGSFINLAAGNYTVTVRDGTGCSTSQQIVITSPGEPVCTVSSTDSSCGLENGTITATGTGGTAPLVYSINGIVFQSSNVFNDLAPGNYTVFVKDVNGCYSSSSVSIGVAALPQVSAYSVPAGCNQDNGIIVALGSGTFSPFIYSLDGVNFQSSNQFSGLAAGSYEITIQDASGCTNTTTVGLTNLDAPSITLTSNPSHCGNADGSITATGSGGTGALQYSIDGLTFQSSTNFSGLSQGAYSLTVQDANGCENTASVLVSDVSGPESISATTIDASCNQNNGSAVATVSGGTAPYDYTIDGVHYQVNGSFTGLEPGDYTITVVDANDCEISIDLTIDDLSGPQLSLISTPISCYEDDGTITVIATGGTVQLSFSNDGSNFQTQNIFTGLSSGDYTVTVQDANNCEASTNVSIGTFSEPPEVTTTIESFVCGETIIATGIGQGGFQYSLDSLNWQISDSFPCLAADEYTVYAMDANGCINSTIVDLVNFLPISLLNFDAYRNEDLVEVDWITVSEQNNDYFIVQRSADGIHFEDVAIVDGAGNSLNEIHYHTRDIHHLPNVSYYRLKQVDFNGDYSYSHKVAVDFESSSTIQIYPNPGDGLFVIEGLAVGTQLKVYNAHAELVFKQQVNDYRNIIDLRHLADGVYLLQSGSNSGLSSKKLIIEK